MFEKGTTNYNLPQWAPTDHPDFLNDMNPAYRTIDKNLGDVTVESANNSKKIESMEALQNAQEDSITQLQNTQNSHTLDIAILQHDMSDAKANIAKNGGDIQLIEADNHQIHEDIAGHLVNYNVLMSWAQLSKLRDFNVGVIGTSGEVSGVLRIQGNMFWLEYENDGNQRVQAETSIDVPLNMNSVGVHNILFTNMMYDSKFVTYSIIKKSDGNYYLHISNSNNFEIVLEKIPRICGYCTYDEIVAANNALNNLTAAVIIQGGQDAISEGGESNVAETAGTSEDNAHNNS